MRLALLIVLAGSLLLGGCATAQRSSYTADLVPGYDPEVPSDWSTIDIGPELLSAKRWGEPVEDIVDFW
ncbi:hypothetical protein K8I31_15695 [bacterium]|nr:hypothetical protein [bacterium]